MEHSATVVDSPALVSVVHAAGLGRVRLHVQGLYGSDALKYDLEKALSAHCWIHEARANCLTGNVLVQFRPEQDQTAIIEEVDRVARRCLNGRIITIAKPKARPFPAKLAQTQPKKLTQSASFTERLKQSFSKPKSSVEFIPSQPVPKHTWHRLDTREAMARLDTSKVGLSVVEAGHRLQIFGPNRLAENKRRSTLEIFTEQLANPAMAMLGVSAVVSVATGGLIDAAFIIIAVLMNAIIVYVTESSS